MQINVYGHWGIDEVNSPLISTYVLNKGQEQLLTIAVMSSQCSAFGSNLDIVCPRGGLVAIVIPIPYSFEATPFLTSVTILCHVHKTLVPAGGFVF